jgi:hypothetical protein
MLAKRLSESALGGQAPISLAMAQDTIPYELKRLIYDYVDLETIRSLRQVSKAWASVGLELLLLPSFFVKSHSVDVKRLRDIGTGPVVSNQAAKTINKVIFQNSGWIPSYFRRIVCSRHEHRRHYEQEDFVPTQAEAEALEELDMMIARRDKDDMDEKDESLLVSALRVVPQVHSIEIRSRNPFRNLILRKVWEEYALEAYPQWHQYYQLRRVLSAAKRAGLQIHHFSHDQLKSSCFENDDMTRESTLYEDINTLKSLDLVVSDHPGVFSSDERAAMRLHQLLRAIPALEHLSIKFEILGAVPLDYLPATATAGLRSLTLSSVPVDPVRFLALLGSMVSTLKRLSLRSFDIPQDRGSWRDLLGNLRDLIGDKLEKFQLFGMITSVDGDWEQWILSPRYDEDWNVLPEERSPRGKEIEDFVLRRGPWPMVASDSFSFP